MKHLLAIFAFFIIGHLSLFTSSWAQDDELSDETFEANMVDEKPETPPTQKVNEYGEVVGGKPEDVLLERKKENLDFKPGFSYDNEGLLFYRWSAYLSYGRQTANVEDDFSSTAALPEDYSMLGLEINRHAQEMPIYLGLRFDQLSELVENTLVKMDYSLSLITLLAGYKITDSIISISVHGGLVLGASGKRTTTSLANNAEATVPFKVGISYNVGVRTIIHFKGMQLGLDGGLLALRNQEVEVGETAAENDLSSNSGGYLRVILGRAF